MKLGYARDATQEGKKENKLLIIKEAT